MSASIGRIAAQLAQPTDETVSPELIALINRNIGPPTSIKESDVYIRAMYVVSDEVNSFGGRFPVEEQKCLAHLLVDSPVMVGHRKDKLPIGRNFHAAVVERNGKSWVKSYFYWLKSTEGAETLRENIDGGIYKECSVGFTFLFPECSICGKDIRICPHEPFQKYTVGNNNESDRVAYFNYRQIERVLETSLVYRGAVPDTSVSKELAMNGGKKKDSLSDQAVKPVCISSLSELDPEKEYLVVPFYESLPVIVTCNKKVLTIQQWNGETIDSKICSRFACERLPEIDQAYGHLVGYRGKERCTVEHVERYLAGMSGPVTRLEIKLFPPAGLALPKGVYDGAPNRIRLIRHCIAGVRNLDQSARSIMTRMGVWLWPLDTNPSQFAGFQYRPLNSDIVEDKQYRLTFTNGAAAALLTLLSGEYKERFQIKQFNLARLLRGGRFIADKVEGRSVQELQSDKTTTQGQVVTLAKRGEGLLLEMVGSLTGKFILRPVKLDEHKRYLFYRLGS